MPFIIVGPGIPRQDNPVFRGGTQIGVVTSGTLSPSLDNGIGMAYIDAEFAEPGTDIEIDIRGKLRPAQTRKKPLYCKAIGLPRAELDPREDLRPVAEEHYPEDLIYHPEHDWARIDGDIATFGITWFAQDALGEIVFFEPPAVGTTVTKDASYGEIESVKAVSEVVAPLSGEIVEVNEALGAAPETINDDPYGAGWMVKIKLSDPSEVAALLDPPRTKRCSRVGAGALLRICVESDEHAATRPWFRAIPVLQSTRRSLCTSDAELLAAHATRRKPSRTF